MENIAQMLQRHQKEIKKLRKNCKHKKITKWLPYMWAPGHFGGQVKICEQCGETMAKKSELPKITKGKTTIWSKE